MPTNVVVCNGNNLAIVASQPKNFSYFDADTPDLAIARSAPTWGLTGTALAWTSFDYTTGDLTLDIFNAGGEGGTVSMPLELPEFAGPISPPTISWHENGIYLFHATLDPNNFTFVEFVFIYDGMGNLVSEAQLPTTDESRYVTEKFVVGDSGQELIGMLYNDGLWELVDPKTGDVQDSEPGVGELYVPAGTSDVALVLSFHPEREFNIWIAATDEGIVYDSDENPVFVSGVFPTSTALSNDGIWVYQLFDGLYYWSMSDSGYIDGTEVATSGFSALAWGDTAWRIVR